MLCFIQSSGVSRGRCRAVDGTWSWATWQPPSVRMLASYGGICSGTLGLAGPDARRHAWPCRRRHRGSCGGSILGPGGRGTARQIVPGPFPPKKISRSPKLWLGPRNLAVLLTHRGQLILGKISKFDATRCQILRQCHGHVQL